LAERIPFHEGDIVTRKSYGGDLFFRVMRVECYACGEGTATLKGVNVRLLADAPLSDLRLADEHALIDLKRKMMRESGEHLRQVRMRRLNEEQARSKRNRKRTRGGSLADDLFEVPGKVLHLDGDTDYLKDCMKYYRDLGVPAVGKHVEPKDQPEHVTSLLMEYSPDVLVLTGHDALKKKSSDRTSVESYWNSGSYIEAVRRARYFEMDRDSLVIIAGACQSFYEALIEAGANFASSPDRVLIHCYDPVLIAEKVVHTPVDEIVRVEDAIENTITKRAGIGGLETRGKLRASMPKTATGLFGTKP
jgi:spore coat assembly protein